MTRPDWLLPPDPAGWTPTGERCDILELCNLPDIPEASVARARVAPGVTTRLHALTGIREIYIIESGQGVAEIEGKRVPVSPGDRVVIAPGQAQRIENTGPGPLEFLCLCSPRFRADAYVDLGEG